MFDGREFPKLHQRPSLLKFIEGLPRRNGILEDSLCELPDEPPLTPGGVGWMAGAFDGVVSHNMGLSGDSSAEAKALALAIARAAKRPRRRELSALYDLSLGVDVLSVIDSTIKMLPSLRVPATEVARIGKWLASESPERGPVKIGIALIGATTTAESSLLHELGAHEEFTLYAAIAFANANRESDLYVLARRVRGWGRINCVELLRDTTDPAISRWILLEGFRNIIHNQYLSLTAATTGGLAEVLADPSPGRHALTAAGDIIQALIGGGPAEDIDAYGSAPYAVKRWLELMERHAETIGDLLTIGSIRDFCDQDDWAERLATTPWTLTDRDWSRDRAVRLLERSLWPDVVRAGIDSPYEDELWNSVRGAGLLGIDVFDQLLMRLDADPLKGPWFAVWQVVRPDRAIVLVDRVRRLLDLDAIASGPTTESGYGPEFDAHAALSWSLIALCEYPGLGSDILVAALQSPTVQDRNDALRALKAWGSPNWVPEHEILLQAVASGDPDHQVRESAAALLEMRPSEPS